MIRASALCEPRGRTLNLALEPSGLALTSGDRLGRPQETVADAVDLGLRNRPRPEPPVEDDVPVDVRFQAGDGPLRFAPPRNDLKSAAPIPLPWSSGSTSIGPRCRDLHPADRSPPPGTSGCQRARPIRLHEEWA